MGEVGQAEERRGRVGRGRSQESHFFPNRAVAHWKAQLGKALQLQAVRLTSNNAQ